MAPPVIRRPGRAAFPFFLGSRVAVAQLPTIKAGLDRTGPDLTAPAVEYYVDGGNSRIESDPIRSGRSHHRPAGRTRRGLWRARAPKLSFRSRVCVQRCRVLFLIDRSESGGDRSIFRLTTRLSRVTSVHCMRFPCMRGWALCVYSCGGVWTSLSGPCLGIGAPPARLANPPVFSSPAGGIDMAFFFGARSCFSPL